MILQRNMEFINLVYLGQQARPIFKIWNEKFISV